MNPNNIVAALTISAIALFAPIPEAEAAMQSGRIEGYDATVVQSGSMQRPDFITIQGPRGEEQITVTCSPFDWNSYGPNTVQWVNRISAAWCS